MIILSRAISFHVFFNTHILYMLCSLLFIMSSKNGTITIVYGIADGIMYIEFSSLKCSFEECWLLV